MSNYCSDARRLARTAAAGALALMTTWGATAAYAASPVPPAIAGKLVEGSNLSRLWNDDGARAPVIIQFAAPALPDSASFASPDLADAAQTNAVHAVQDQILGRFLGGSAEISKAESSPDLIIKRMDFSPMFGINVTRAELEKLAADPAVVSIHEDEIYAPTLLDSLPLIQMPAAYAAGATGNGFRVAVLDTGARRSHEFLNPRITSAACFGTTNAQYGSTSYCPGGASSSTNIDSANDCEPTTIFGCGHGTHTNGTAGGFNSNLQAGEPQNGVSRDGRLININVFSRFSLAGGSCGNLPAQYTGGCVLTFNTDQMRGLEYVYSQRNTGLPIAAASMSLGGGASSTACDSNTLKPIIDQLRAANIATIIAAGNDGLDTQVGAPGCISSAITVASSTKQDSRSSFSNWGTLIDVVAPGSDILASYPNGNSNTSYSSLSGTSMATPHVAGVWAALRTRVPNATVTQIETALENTGLSISSAGTTKPRIRVNNALTSLLGGPPPSGPANDHFANRTNVPAPSTVTGTNVEATAETNEPIHAGRSTARNSVWWRFTAGSSGQITIDTIGSNFDTVLAVYSGSAVGALTGVASNDDIGNGSLQSSVTFTGTAGVQYQIAVAGYDNAQGTVTLRVQGGAAAGAPNIVSAVLPAARPTQVGTVVTALATVINAGNAAATSCSIALPAGTQNIAFAYRTVANNGALGPVNTPVSIAAGATQNFVMGFTPSAVMTTNIALVFDCTNSNPAPSILGLNRFLLTATATPTADIITTAATSPTPGIMDVPLGSTGASAVASINIGSTASVRAQMSASALGAPAGTLPGTMRICRTDPNTSQCITPLTNSFVDYTATANQTATFSAFFVSNGTAIPFDPANKRLYINFTQGATAVGSTSIAIRTVAPDTRGALETASTR